MNTAFLPIIRDDKTTRRQILNNTITGEDILMITEDTKLSPGWQSLLYRTMPYADIIGSCMIEEDGTVQDTGYDLVRESDRVHLEPQNRGRRASEIEPFGYRECSTVCGCFLFVKGHVFKQVPEFRDGYDRWEEFIFTQEARRLGYVVAVMDHFTVHYGGATKRNISTSYRTEKKLWERVCSEYVQLDDIQYEIEPVIDARLRETLLQPNLLIYGVGSVASWLYWDCLSGSLHEPYYATGLPEEVGTWFRGYRVHDYNKLNPALYTVINTAPIDLPGAINVRSRIEGKRRIYYQEPASVAETP